MCCKNAIIWWQLSFVSWHLKEIFNDWRGIFIACNFKWRKNYFLDTWRFKLRFESNYFHSCNLCFRRRTKKGTLCVERVCSCASLKKLSRSSERNSLWQKNVLLLRLFMSCGLVIVLLCLFLSRVWDHRYHCIDIERVCLQHGKKMTQHALLRMGWASAA